MWVKCPKCRFRYNQPGGDHGEEIQCVCPRCGTPFTFAANTSDDSSLKDAENIKDETELLKVSSSSHQHRAAYGLHGDGEEATSVDKLGSHQTAPYASHADISSNTVTSHSGADSFKASTSNSYSPGFEPSYQNMETPNHLSEPSLVRDSIRQRHSKRRYLLALITMIVLAFFLIYEFSGSDDNPTNLGVEEVSDANVQPDEDLATPAFDASAPEEKAPAWIQGTWKVNTKYGGIIVSIRDNRITETSAGETSHGSFHYQHHRLYCDFGNGETFVYRLDMKARQIDAGQGLLMKKLDQ